MTTQAALPVPVAATVAVAAVKGRGQPAQDPSLAAEDASVFEDFVTDAEPDDLPVDCLSFDDADSAPPVPVHATVPQGPPDVAMLLAMVAAGPMPQQLVPAAQQGNTQGTAAPKLQMRMSGLNGMAQIAQADGADGGAAMMNPRPVPSDLTPGGPADFAQSALDGDGGSLVPAGAGQDSTSSPGSAGPRMPTDAHLPNGQVATEARMPSGEPMAATPSAPRLVQPHAADQNAGAALASVAMPNGGSGAQDDTVVVNAKSGADADNSPSANGAASSAVGAQPAPQPVFAGLSNGQDRRGDTDGGAQTPALRRSAVKVEVVRQETHFAPVVNHAVLQQVADQTAQALVGTDSPAAQTEARATGSSSIALPTNVKLADGVVKVMQFQLQPVDLGTVTVRVSMRDDAVELHVEASRDQTARIIREDRDALSRMLGAHGIKVDGLIVTVGEADRSQGGGMGQQSGQGGSASFQSSAQSQSGSTSGGRGQGGDQSGQQQFAQEQRGRSSPGGVRQRSSDGDIFI